MPELDEQIRYLIDVATEPVTLDEVRSGGTIISLSPSGGRRSRRAILGAAAAVVLVAVGVVAVSRGWHQNGNRATKVVTPASGSTPPAEPCFGVDRPLAAPGVAVYGTDPINCKPDLAVRTAEARLGVKLQSPRYIPKGFSLDGLVWTVGEGVPGMYAVLVPETPMTPSPRPGEEPSGKVFSRQWSPKGGKEYVTPGGTVTADLVQLELAQRVAVPGRPWLLPGSPNQQVRLASGIEAQFLDTGDRLVLLEWADRGVDNRVLAKGLSNAAVFKFASSVR